MALKSNDGKIFNLCSSFIDTSYLRLSKSFFLFNSMRPWRECTFKHVCQHLFQLRFRLTKHIVIYFRFLKYRASLYSTPETCDTCTSLYICLNYHRLMLVIKWYLLSPKDSRRTLLGFTWKCCVFLKILLEISFITRTILDKKSAFL